MSQSQETLIPELDQSPQAGELGFGGKRGESKETLWLRLWETSARAQETHLSSYQRSLTSSVTALSPGEGGNLQQENVSVQLGE